jgi:hypothetical protein
MSPKMSPEALGPERVPGDLAAPLIREIGGWLDGADPDRIAAVTTAWGARTRAAARRLIAAHGLSSLLARDPTLTPIAAVLPAEIQAWLAVQDEHSRARVGRLHEELADALRVLAGAGIAAMPLKGSILTTRGGPERNRRPMADLDILVRPADREAARLTLERLGYRRRAAGNRRPTHDTFIRSGNEDVVSFDGEHPDNPRWIELHVEVKRHLWAWVDDDELTDFLWLGAAPGFVLGEAAVLPTQPALLAHLAIHATSDLLTGRGRLSQWFELAELAPDVGDARELAALPHPRLVFPALGLSTRRLAGRLGPRAPELGALEMIVPERLVRWAASVPLDTRAGLQSGRFGPADMSSFGARWQRWAPSSWRLAVAYGDVPRPLALARHAARVARMALRRPA